MQKLPELPEPPQFPAFASLWVEGGFIGGMALAVKGAGELLTARVPRLLLGLFAAHWHLASGGVGARMLNVMMIRPEPIALLAITVFYLWMYVRIVRTQHKNPAEIAQSV